MHIELRLRQRWRQQQRAQLEKLFRVQAIEIGIFLSLEREKNTHSGELCNEKINYSLACIQVALGNNWTQK
jgi:hypothetical protein